MKDIHYKIHCFFFIYSQLPILIVQGTCSLMETERIYCIFKLQTIAWLDHIANSIARFYFIEFELNKIQHISAYILTIGLLDVTRCKQYLKMYSKSNVQNFYTNSYKIDFKCNNKFTFFLQIKTMVKLYFLQYLHKNENNTDNGKQQNCSVNVDFKSLFGN